MRRLSLLRLRPRLCLFPRYRLVQDTDGDDELEKQQAARSLVHTYSPYWLWANAALFGLSIVVFAVSLWLHLASRKPNFLLKQISMPCKPARNNFCVRSHLMIGKAPVLDDVEIKIQPKRMDATLLESSPLSIFRQEPSDEVDHAWRQLGDTRPIPLTREQVLAIGKDPQQAVRIPESWGLGPDMYAGRIDVFHQIHCLDSLRREAYFEHYYGSKYPGGFNDTTPMHRLHLSHCVYLLLQNILCNANTDVYTHFWTDTLHHPFPDFNIHHQCRDFEAVRDWQNRHALDEEAFVALRRPDDYGPPHVMSHRFKEVHGFFRNHEDYGQDVDGEIG